MDIIDGQIHLGLDLDSDINAQAKTKAHGTDKLYKFKVAKQFEYIMFAIFIFEVVNGF